MSAQGHRPDLRARRPHAAAAKLMEQSVVQLPAGRRRARRIARADDRHGDGARRRDRDRAERDRERRQLDLPAQGDCPAKTIKASTLVAAGDGRRGAADRDVRRSGRLPRDARGARRPAPADRPARARSLRLIVHTKPGLRRSPAGGVPRQRQVHRRHQIDRRGAESASIRSTRIGSTCRRRRATPGRRRPSPTAS